MRDKKREMPGSFLLAWGMILVVAAFALVGWNLLDDRRAGTAAKHAVEALERATSSAAVPASSEALTQANARPGETMLPDYVLNPQMEMPTAEDDGSEYVGTLEIPALELELPVLEDWSYPSLRVAPCRYSGSAYQEGFVIAAHNYRSHFGRIGDLSYGDCVVFTDVDGNAFSYTVREIQTLESTAIEEMLSTEWDLSLFTCTLGGQKRLTVRCERTEDALVLCTPAERGAQDRAFCSTKLSTRMYYISERNYMLC